jgi:uncharacterized protein
MAHDVFISHSAKDKVTGDAVCAMLESNGIRCWIAPRDVTPGMEWGECIIEAIKQSRIMVLVFSTHANESPQIRREIERAVNHGVAILPLRIEDVQPGMALEYFIGNVHWLDALTPPLENHLKNLAGTVKILIGRMEPRDAGPMPGTVAQSSPPAPPIQPAAPSTQTDSPRTAEPAGFAVIEKLQVQPEPATAKKLEDESIKSAAPESIPNKKEKLPEPPQKKSDAPWKSGIFGGEQVASQATQKPDEAARGIFQSVVGSDAPSRQINRKWWWIGVAGISVLVIGIASVLWYVQTRDPEHELETGYHYLAEGRKPEAAEMFRRSAEQGNYEAANRLCWMYYNADGIPRDYSEAAKWFRVVAEKGSRPTTEISTLGYLYYAGLGVPQDFNAALILFRRAAEQNDVPADYFLGDAYEKGNGVTKDKVAACVWYLEANKNGNAQAGERLKNLEAKMTAAQIDEVKKQADDRIAHRLGNLDDADVQVSVGEMYENDHFYAEALNWYRKAADQGQVEAEVNLGRLYESGQGVPQDYAQAFLWWHKAAERENSDAEYDLGTLYENGQGVPRDIAQARSWYQKAADGGDDEAKKRLAELDGKR